MKKTLGKPVMGRWVLTAGLCVLLSGCAATLVDQANTFSENQEWLNAVLTYRKAEHNDPDNVTIKYKLRNAELNAAEYYYQRGKKLEELENLDGAIAEYQRGITAMPEYTKLRQSLGLSLAKKESEELYLAGLRYADAGKNEDAAAAFMQAVKINPDEQKYRQALQRLKLRENDNIDGKLVLTSRSPITLNFRNTKLKAAFDFVAQSFGINVIFDNEVSDTPVTVYAKDVTFEQALDLILATTKTFYKPIGPNSILVASDTPGKRGQYEDYIIRTFHLSSIKAKDMLDILKTVMEPKKVIINEQLNTLVVRDTEDKLKLIDHLIENNDRKPAEILMEVEILEINRTKSERLGLDFGQRLALTYPEHLISNALSYTLSQGILKLPQITFDYFKQDVDAKILANPRIRVLNSQEALIHIGDRVPLRSATIQDATGQIRNTFEYKDIGIRLKVLPDIHLDNSATVKLGLEVSSLGANLGTDNEPAYSIGTRNAETVMLLRDGETAVLGGLIRDEERKSWIRLPGLGDVPVLGWLFGKKDNLDGRTDVLLTITPHVVRALDLPPKEDLQFYSGTEKTFSDKARFAYFKTTADTNVNPIFTTGEDARQLSVNSHKPAFQVEPAAAGATLYFSQPTYEAHTDTQFDIIVEANQLNGADQLPLQLLFDPQLVEYVSSEAVSDKVSALDVVSGDEQGVLKLNLKMSGADMKEATDLVRITFKGVAPGVSYLVYRGVQYTTVNGESVSASVQASRMLIN